jgi:hypothetical protein
VVDVPGSGLGLKGLGVRYRAEFARGAGVSDPEVPVEQRGPNALGSLE